ncbi:MAG: 3-deoxy-D-manno-octulosonate 8-phosphate phosphatase [Betaproteobacteria bacterium]|nr:3-deoxy-D-manno-octulosonate 8-phosphate phosphatase [Betaproteobacteria bacterium]
MSTLRGPRRPVLEIDPRLLLRAQPVRVAFFDVDGVLTDGGLYFSEHGGASDDSAPYGARETIKRFHTLDGHGLKLLQRAGITPAVISGRDSPALRARVQALGITHAHFGQEDKRPLAEQTLAALGLQWAQAAAMGDDWPDLPVLQAAAISCAPANAHVEVRARVDYVTQAAGGQGAARQWCDLLLVAGGHYARILEEYGA